MNQRHHIFLAEDLTHGESDPEPEEAGIELLRVPVSEFEKMMLDGRIVDNCTVSAWGVYLLWRKHQDFTPDR